MTLAISGELDLATAKELAAVVEGEKLPGRHLNLDFGECGFIDSSGLQVVVASARQIRELGGRLTVTGLKGEVEALFEMTGLLVSGSAVERLEP